MLIRSLLFALALPLNAASTSPPPLGSLVDVGGGHRVHLYCTGSSSPTVIVAGGAFSFDWALIQPQVAKFTRICTYDVSGTAWSDPYPAQTAALSCAERVQELHQLLENAAIPDPYVLVGFSIGGMAARLFAQDYRASVAGMIIVDHAFPVTASDAAPPHSVSSTSLPVLVSAPPITFGLEDDRNFARLPKLDRDLHAWATSLHPARPDGETIAHCETALDKRPPSLGAKPLIVISTNNDTPGYHELQQKLLSLSRNSKQVIAENSSHMVIIDQPDLVVDSIRQVVTAAHR